MFVVLFKQLDGILGGVKAGSDADEWPFVELDGLYTLIMKSIPAKVLPSLRLNRALLRI